MSIREIPSRSDLVHEAYDAIKAAIMAGDLQPGAYLAQESLAAKLGVSRQPVSHALMLLRHDGLVVERGRKGQMVAPLDPHHLLSLYQVRGALDRLAAELTATRLARLSEGAAAGPGGGLDGGLGTDLTMMLADGSGAIASNDIARLVEADLAFHRLIYKLSGNPELGEMADAAWPHMVRSMRVLLTDIEQRQKAWDDHRRIVKAILDGDVAEAGNRAAQHAEEAGEATFACLLEIAKNR
ncbi:MAG: GntR family transcriptional regulator [Alphaproteobacteria bacterium]|nr:GntR family transcriptional regulator [Alphaproteobacteria bacterium SS10]